MMRCAPALPIYQLMPAAGSHKPPVATPIVGGLPGKIERPHPFSDPHVGHPIDHHVAGPLSVDPGWAPARATRLPNHVLVQEAADDLNHNVFACSLTVKHAVDRSRPQGRSSSLPCGRSSMTPTTVHRPQAIENRAKQPKKMPHGSTFTGVPNTDKGSP